MDNFKKISSTRIIIFYTIFLTITGQMAIDLYLPSMPSMVKALQMDQTHVQWSISAYLLGYGFSQLIYGPLSDWYGRRKVLLFGLILFVISSFGCSIVYGTSMLLIFRIIQGLGSGAASVIARAIMRDTFSGKELSKASSHMAMAWSLVPILAPILGGRIELLVGWKGNFIFLGIFSVCLLFFAIYTFPETCQTIGKSKLTLRKVMNDYLLLLQNIKFSLNMILLILLFSIFTIFNVSSPFVFQTKFHMNAGQYSIVLCLISIGYLSGSYLNKKLIARTKATTLTFMGITIILLSSILMLCKFSDSLYSMPNAFIILIYMMIVLVGLGLIFSNALSACLQPFPKHAGIASAMYGFLVFVGGSIISGLYSKYTATAIRPLIIVVLFISCIMMIVQIIIKFVIRDEQN